MLIPYSSLKPFIQLDLLTMKKILLVFLSIIFLSSLVFSQDYFIRYKKESLLPKSNIRNFDHRSAEFENAFFEDHYYALIQFDRLPDLQEQERLERIGVELLGYIPNNAYWTKINQSVFEESKDWNRFVRHISPISPKHKISHLEDYLDKEFYTWVRFHDELSEEKARRILNGLYLDWDEFKSGMAKIRISKEKMYEIALHPAVAFVSPTTKDEVPLLEENRETHGVKSVTHPSELGLSGNGVRVCVGDGGTILSHVDLENRIINEESKATNGHGSAVSGIVAGEGILDPTAVGMAPQAEIVAEYFSNAIFGDDFYHNNFDVVITNNSYSGGIISNLCLEAGGYTPESVDVDQSLRTLNQVTHVFASANDGNNDCTAFTGYSSGYSTVRNAWNSAKNTLTVGATDYLNNIASYSSKGPVMDGRLKPEIVATGTLVYSTNSFNNYNQGSGTSFSSPTVSGVLALLYEHYKNLNGGVNPRGDLMKAVVCNTADDLGNTGPDYQHGYGALNTRRAAELITNGNYLFGSIAQGGNLTHDIVLPTDAQKLKVMLYWHDEAGVEAANPALVNNLDITLNDGTTTHYPWILDPAPAACANPATKGVDTLNNMEQVELDFPTAGTYTVNIDGTSIPMGLQDYVLVYDIIDEHLDLNSPLGGEEYVPGESINITWNAAGHDTLDFTLEFSVDNGTAWDTISSTVPGTDRNYEWTIPDTITDQALIRITWNDTGLADQSNATFSIMQGPLSFSYDTDCDGGVTLSWAPITTADSYDVMEYDGVVWNVLANVATNTYSLSGLNNGQTYYFAIRAVSSGGTVSRRSRAAAVLITNSTAGTISSYPYLEDFETDDGGWYSLGKNDTWEWTTPANTLLNRSAEGQKCWVSNATGNYLDAGSAYLYSPCFDLSSMTNPVISFGTIYSIEDAEDGSGYPYYDFMQLQYSTNGRNWIVLGANGQGHNWYNNYQNVPMWDNQKLYWHSAAYEIPITDTRVYFRYLMNSDPFTNEEGAAIDNIHIYEADSIYADTTVLGITQAVSGTDWIHFDSGGGDRLVSINPNGNDLGNVYLDTYLQNDTARHDGYQYYLDRNWKLDADNEPSSPVSIRLYFLDTEFEALRTATGCTDCTKPTDAFSIGVTRYAGINENGMIEDNDAFGYSTLLPEEVEVVPYDQGYYVELDMATFSEFYINGGNCGGLNFLPCDGCSYPPNIAVDLGNDQNKVVLNWDSVPDVTEYQVKYRRTLTTTWNNLIATTTTRVISGLTQNKLYDYRVRSRCLDGTWSDMSVIDKFRTVKCRPPNNLVSSQFGLNKVKIEWDNYNFADKYQIWFRIQGGTEADWQMMVTYYTGMNFRVLNNLIPDTTYEYKVRSWCEVSYGSFSDIHTFTNTNTARKIEEGDFSILQLFPNPNNGVFLLNYSLGNKGEVEIMVMDVLGRQVMQKNIIGEEGLNSERFDLSGLDAGYYLIGIASGDSSETLKWVKE